MREPLLVCGKAYLVYTARCLNIFGYYINSILTHVALVLTSCYRWQPNENVRAAHNELHELNNL